MQDIVKKIIAAIGLSFIFMGGSTSLAQGLPSGVTPQQVEQFRSLPRAQQERLLRERGVDSSVLRSNREGVQVSPPENGGLEVEQEQPTDLSGDEEAVDAERGQRTGRGGLSFFGYDLFRGQASTFAPVTEIPIPTNYIMGPGDTVRVHLWGQINRQMDLPVSRDGTIDFPEVGPIPVAGLSFDELKEQLQQIISEAFIGVRSSIGLGQLRSIRVFVMGEVNRPGSYTVSSLSTMTNALMVSGGIRTTGSLRNIQLRRQGVTVAHLDLYDLLLRGDTSDDERLMPGDVLFIPPVGPTVGIDGEVRRPAIYELKDRQSVASLLELSGGLTPDANPEFTQILRITERRQRHVVDLDLTQAQQLQTAVQDGDLVRIGSVNDLVDGFVTVEGAAFRPGSYRWSPNIRVSEVIGSVTLGLEPQADLEYALIIRETGSLRRIEVHQFQLGEALEHPLGEADPMLSEKDRVIILSQDAEMRRDQLEPILARLIRQSTPGQPRQVVSVAGAVQYPGDYPLPINGDVRSLITAAGGLVDSALLLEAELARFERTPQGDARTRIMAVNLQAELASTSSPTVLSGRDRLLIKQVPQFGERLTVTLQGEVSFPGEYTVQRGETLGQLIQRAGGLREDAFLAGAVFSRESLRQKEQARLTEAAQRVRAELAGVLLNPGLGTRLSADDISELEFLLTRIEAAPVAGRMVIDLPAVLAGNDVKDIVLLDGDTLAVPRIPQTVSVYGQVQHPTNHLFDGRMTVQDYIGLSGGAAAQADIRRTYVVQANGSVWLPRQSSWYEGASRRLQPGDTIVVPVEVGRVDRWQQWTSLTQILYQTALAAAAVNSF